jgi:predicted ATP-grasp superfamily ATP-dependent carboligase
MVLSKKYKDIINKTNKPIAFILGKYIVTGLGISRSFGIHKIPVFWLDSNPEQVGFLSRYCHGIHCPELMNNDREYVDFLTSIGKKLNNKGVLFPITDLEVSAILKNRNILEQYFHIPIANFNITNLLIDKKNFYSTLEKYGISYPKTYFLNDTSDLKKYTNEIKYPCIVKPTRSEIFRRNFKTKFFMVDSSKQLLQSFKKANSKDLKVMIQEYIPGHARYMYGFNAYYDKKFHPHGQFVYRRIRQWPPYSGNGVFIEKHENSEFEKIVTDLVKKIKFYGILDAEFKIDSRDNKINLIEINPRCWMQVSFPLQYGINLPLMAYLDAIGKDFKTENIEKKQVKFLFTIQDFYAAVHDMKNHKLTLIEWLSSYKGKKEYAIFSWTDPLPFFKYLWKIRVQY